MASTWEQVVAQMEAGRKQAQEAEADRLANNAAQAEAHGGYQYAIPKPKPLATTLMDKADLADKIKADRASQLEVDAVTGAAPAPVFQKVDAVTGAAPMPKALTPEPVSVAPVPEPVVEIPEVKIPEVTNGQRQAIEEIRPSFDWNKVGEIAKSTGKGIVGALQAAIAGRTAGLAGRAFNPATETMAGIEKGKALDVENQGKLMDKQLSMAQKLKELDQGFQASQTAIAQDFEAKQRMAEQEFQLTRDKAAYDRAVKEAQAERAQRMEELKFAAAQQVNIEKLKMGVGGGASLTAGDPSNLRAFDPKAAKK